MPSRLEVQRLAAIDDQDGFQQCIRVREMVALPLPSQVAVPLRQHLSDCLGALEEFGKALAAMLSGNARSDGLPSGGSAPHRLDPGADQPGERWRQRFDGVLFSPVVLIWQHG